MELHRSQFGREHQPPGGDAATVECALDGAAYAACTSPASYTGLGAGSHDFRVRGADLAGNAAEATRSWTVVGPDAPSAPQLQAASDSGRSASDGLTNALAPVFDGSCADGTSVRFYVDGSDSGTAVPCSGALIAWRSAAPRRGPFGELISGSHRRRPNTVSTQPCDFACARLSSM